MEIKKEPREIKRKRYGLHRWSASETQLLLGRVLNAVKGDASMYEKPTANAFYGKVFGDTELAPLGWILLKNKMRNLRQTYIQARSWKEDTAANNENDEKTISEHVLNICPYWELLHEIFGSQPNRLQQKRNLTTLDEESISNSAFTKFEIQMQPRKHIMHRQLMARRSRTRTVNIRSRLHPNTPIASSSKLEKLSINLTKEEHFKLEMEKITLQREIEEKKLQFERERLQYEKEKFQQEMNMRKYEIDQEMEVKILELNLKYKTNVDEMILP